MASQHSRRSALLLALLGSFLVFHTVTSVPLGRVTDQQLAQEDEDFDVTGQQAFGDDANPIATPSRHSVSNSDSVSPSDAQDTIIIPKEFRFQETKVSAAATCAFWTKKTTSGAIPAGRSKAGAVIVGNGARLVMVGGQTSSGGLEDSAVLDVQSGAWTTIVAGGDAGGLARVGAAMTSQPDDGGDGANLFLFGGMSTTALENDLLQLSISGASPPALSWAKIETQGEAPSARKGATLTTLTDKSMVMIGGTTGNKSLSGVYFLKRAVSTTGTVYAWSAGALASDTAAKPTGRSGHSAVTWTGTNGDRVVVMGGAAADGTVLGDVAVLNPSTASGGIAWNLVTVSGSLPTGSVAARRDHSAAVVAGVMYVFGGCGASACYSDVLALDLATMAWKTLSYGVSGTAALPSARGGSAVALRGDSLFFFSGCGVGSANCVAGNEVGVLDTATSCDGQCLNGGYMSSGVCVCPSGYSGKFCSNAAPASTPAAGCPSDCSGHGTCSAGTCTCASGYDGADCSNQLPAPCANNCNGHGTCNSGVCQCTAGFFGPQCGSMSCPGATSCTGNGKCHHDSGLCECYPGYGGDACEESGLCPQNCTNAASGTCTGIKSTNNGTTSIAYQCVCASGWSGVDCSLDIRCPEQLNVTTACNGQGKCSNFTCVCTTGFAGKRCEYRTCPGADASKGTQCSGHGACNNATGLCLCDKQFMGASCSEQPSCKDKCGPNGMCVRDEEGKAPVGFDGVCACVGEFTGAKCDQKACPTGVAPGPGPESSANATACSGATRGSCNTGTGVCACLSGYAGLNCALDCPLGKVHVEAEDGSVSLATCGGRGQCVTSIAGEAVCMCAPGRAGPNCTEVVGCVATNGTEPCSGNGVCHSGQCFCNKGFSGADCSAPIPCPRGLTAVGGANASAEAVALEGKVCNGHGVCSAGSCYCAPGWKGKACTNKKACPGDCNAVGTCSLGQCFCAPGFTGKDCSVKEPCPDDCSGHGICFSSRCVCESGYSGTNCGAFEVTALGVTAGASSSASSSSPRFAQLHMRQQAMVKSSSALALAAAAPPAATEGCPNDCGGADKGMCVLGRCMCLPGFNGADCGEVAPSNCDPVCAQHGVCKYNKCFCNPGWKGNNCSTPVPCPDDCSGHGECKFGHCFCAPGFRGMACNYEVLCLNSCSDRGICVKGECLCNPGFGGEDCSQVTQGTEICPKACAGHGVCQIGQCFCDPGWGGRDCANQVAAPCKNDCFGQGECVHGDCFCHPGFSGEDCSQVLACPAGCAAHGVCRYGKCFCQRGFGGDNCSRPIGAEEKAAEAAEAEKSLSSVKRPCPNACSQHGFCYRGRCMCEPGYDGVACETVTLGHKQCPNSCRGIVDASWLPGGDAGASPARGLCSLGKCFCFPGFSGSACEVEDRMPCPADCSNNGLCRYGKCFCKYGYEGVACEKELKDCPHNCHGNGVCSRGRCLCHFGFKGEFCGQPLDHSPCPNKCNNRGVCVMGKCFCEAGYTGASCANSAASQTVVKEQKHVSDAENTLKASGAPDKAPAKVVVVGTESTTPPTTAAPTALPPPIVLTGGNSSGGTVLINSTASIAAKKIEGAAAKAKALAEQAGAAANGTGLATEEKKTILDVPDLSNSTAANSTEGNETASESNATAPTVFLEMGSSDDEDVHCAAGCSDRGVCHRGRCFCHPGFSGADCAASAACPGNCGGESRGMCHRGRCFCSPGFSGEDCSARSACPKDCSGRGTCHAGSCVCFPSYSGRDCGQNNVDLADVGSVEDVSAAEVMASPCASGCNGRGLCRGGLCYCSRGFAGDACELPVGDNQEGGDVDGYGVDEGAAAMRVGAAEEDDASLHLSVLSVAGIAIVMFGVGMLAAFLLKSSH